MILTTRHIKAARALLSWSQADLAKASGVSEPTVARLEAVDGPLGGRSDTADRIRGSLEAAGIEFDEGEQLGVRLKIARPDEGKRPDQLTAENDG